MQSLTMLINHDIMSLTPNSREADGSTPWSVLANIAPGLLRMDEDGDLLPSLATEWNHNAEFTEFQFTIRTGVRLHSGRILTPELVIWNFERFFSGKFDTLFAHDYRGLVDMRRGKGNTVEFEFDRPFPDFLNYLAWRTCIVDDVADQPCGAGPFKLKEWHRGQHVILERFENYYEQGEPVVDEVKVIWAASGDEKVALIRSGTVDVIENVPMLAAEKLCEAGLLNYRVVSSTRRAAIVMNTTSGIFSDLRVREAIACALDRKELTKVLFGDNASPLTRSVLSGTPNPELAEIPVDIERAKKLLAAAGISKGTVIRGVSTNVAPFPKVVEFANEAFAPLGITLDIRYYEDPPWWPLVYLETDWDIAFQGMGVRPGINVALQRDHRSDGSFNASGFAHAELDEWIDLASSLPEGPERTRAQLAAETLLHQYLPILPLYSANACFGWRPGITGLSTNALGYLDLRQVRLEA